MKFKRDNWTKEQAINIVEGNKLCGNHSICELHKHDVEIIINDLKQSEILIWANNDLINLINSKGNTSGFQFLEYQIKTGFMSNESDYDALAMDIYTGHIYHVGKTLPQK